MKGENDVGKLIVISTIVTGLSNLYIQTQTRHGMAYACGAGAKIIILLIIIFNTSICHAGVFGWFSGSGTIDSPIEIPKKEVKKIKIKSLSYNSENGKTANVEGQIYNGSNWHIVSFILRLTVNTTGQQQDFMITTTEVDSVNKKRIPSAFEPKKVANIYSSIGYSFYLGLNKHRGTHNVLEFKGYKKSNFSTKGTSKHPREEKDYQEEWCGERNGEVKYTLEDRTRIDCLLPEYAIEFAFAEKWAESIGQALYCGEMAERKPGVVLILESKKDEKYLDRLNEVAEDHGITVWVISNY
ncbi:MAG: hypothetical protein ACUZ8O_08720 [Candidatus Anammoxibacter sp.]